MMSTDHTTDAKLEEVSVSSDENATMEELLEALEDYTPTVPDALAAQFLQSAGFESCDPQIVRIMSVAAQKYISDIANDALQHCKMRGNNNSLHSNNQSTNKDKKNNNAKDQKYTLTIEDLVPALVDHRINVRKPNYYV